MTIQDDRTEKQKQTHDWLVVGSDSYLSGWRHAKGKDWYVSWAAWACKLKDIDAVERAVRSRFEMKRVRVVHGPSYRPSGRVHLHIYLVGDHHPALAGSFR